MVDPYTDKWIEETNYKIYPKEEWCMYDYLAVAIQKSGYKIKTTMENLITMILLFVDEAIENGTDIVRDNPEDIMYWVQEQGGLSEFDWKA